MKAAVLSRLGSEPEFKDFTDPVPQNDQQIVMRVKAAALKNLDKLKTYKDYYAPYQTLPVVVGTDGVGVLDNGQMVYAHGITGTMAQKALVSADRYTVLPDNIDPAVAAALPNAVLGSSVPLKVRANMKPGQVVVINGATGITGKVAVQIAKHYGASRIIGIGRNENVLESLKSLGADDCISLNQSDEDFINKLKNIDKESPIDIVIDYLWGNPADMIINAFKNRVGGNVTFVNVGDMASSSINLTSGSLRSTDITLTGSGFGSLNQEVLKRLTTEFLPEMFSLAAQGKLIINTENRRLEDISLSWNSSSSGKRIVIEVD